MNEFAFIVSVNFIILNFFTPIWSRGIPLTSGSLLVLKNSDSIATEDGIENYVCYFTGLPGRGYFFAVDLGTPTQQINLLADTGSSDLAVASRRMDNVDHWFQASQSSSLSCSEYIQYVQYQQGSWTGRICTENMHIALLNHEDAAKNNESDQKHVAFRVQLALIDQSQNFFLPHNRPSWFGIAGLAFTSLSRDIIPKGQHRTNTHGMTGFATGWERMWLHFRRSSRNHLGMLESLFKQAKLANVFTLVLCGMTQSPTSIPLQQMSGKMIFATKTANRKTPEPLTQLYTPILRPWYYEVVLTDVLLEDQSVVSHCKQLNFDKTIVDSGTTNIHLPLHIYARLVKIMIQFVMRQDGSRQWMELNDTNDFWLGNSTLCLDAQGATVGGLNGMPYVLFPFIELQMVSSVYADNFVISVTLSPQQYLRYLGRSTPGERWPGRDCFAFGIQPSRLGTILGSTFLEGFEVEFDRENMQIGLRNSSCNRYTSLTGVSGVNGLKRWNLSQSPMSRCAFHRPDLSRIDEEITRQSAITALCTSILIILTIPIMCLLPKPSS